VAAFSTLGGGVREAEINPLMVKAQGVVAVDARVVFKDA
jgi:succinyl-CoA synthetase beta subunit